MVGTAWPVCHAGGLLKIAPDVYDITVFAPNPTQLNVSCLAVSREMNHRDIMLNDVDWYEKNKSRAASRQENRERSNAVPQGRRRRRHGELYDRSCSDRIQPSFCRCRARNLEGVITYATSATRTRYSASKKYRHAVVIGGGLLDWSGQRLKLRGMNVTVVIDGMLMGRQLDCTAAQLLRQSLEPKACNSAAEANPEIVATKWPCSAVRFEDGSENRGRLVVMAVRSSGDTELAESAGCTAAGDRRERPMQTFAEDYAVGESAAHRVPPTTGAPAVRDGKVCATSREFLTAATPVGDSTNSSDRDRPFRPGIHGRRGHRDIVLKTTRRRCVQAHRCATTASVGRVLYGDTVRRSWYFQLRATGRYVAEDPRSLISARNHLGTTGHQGRAARSRWPTPWRCAAATAFPRA